MATPKPAAPPAPKPLVPETWFDVASQRSYIIGVGVVLQGIKLYEVLRHYIPQLQGSSLSWLLYKWSFVDIAYILSVPLLRIPWLTVPPYVRIRLILVAVLFNWLLMGNCKIPTSLLIPTSVRSMFDYQMSISEHRVRVQDVVQPGQHLSGQHTVRLSPVSTAELNPQGLRFCFAPSQRHISVPVLVNNTIPHNIKFSIESLEDASDIRYVTVDRHGLGNLALVQRYPSGMPEEEFGPEPPKCKALEANTEGQNPLQLEDTKGLVYIRVDRPGVVRLESILDSTDEEIRITRGGSVTIPQCPSVSFLVDSREPHAIPRCQGETFEGTLMVKGVPPLAVQYWREFDGKREDLYANGIDDDTKTSRGVQTIQVPVPLDLPRPGFYSYGLTSVTDSLGNTITAANLPSGTLDSFTVNVLSQPMAEWMGCSVDRPKSMAKGEEMRLFLRVSNGNVSDAPWDVQVQHTAPDGTVSERIHHVTAHDLRYQTLEYALPGDYTILSVKGKLCDGVVKGPEVCRILVWPEPSMTVKFEPIVDRNCNVETGFMAHVVFQGTPPFSLSYVVKKDGRVVDTRQIPNIQSTQYDLELQPSQGPGSYQYSLTEFGDNHYKKQQPSHQTGTVEQIVHTIADAQLVTPPQPIKLWSCSGKTVNVDLKLQGVAPWNVELQISSPRETNPLRISGITSKEHTVSVALPSDIDEYGGHFEIALVNIEDQKQCKRALNRPRIGVDVSRNKATARFTGVAAGTRDIQIIQGDSTKLPLRVTGDGPIRVRWENVNEGISQWTSVKGQNEDLDVRHAGQYRLLEVIDAHGCPGYCDEQVSTSITFINRPTARWPTSAGELDKYGNIVRKPICEGIPDHIELELSGSPLFTVSYKHEIEGNPSELPPVEVSSPLKSARIDLASYPSGKHIYTVEGLKDTNYGVRLSDLPKLHQQVLAKPSAFFKSDTRLPFCLHDSFVRRNGYPNAEILLKGQAPFDVKLSIRNSDSSSRKVKVIHVESNEWDVEFPDYVFDKIGPHQVRIESVTDASGCPEARSPHDLSTLFIDVAETAAILPMETRSDYCVGDTVQYQLEGTSPWIVTYDFNGRESRPTSKTAKFSRLAEKPGIFTVTSISHQNNLCVTNVDNVKAIIYDLPSAAVAPGRSAVESIREGDQAQIEFSFTGEPPFTFTYQRSEISKKGKNAKVLETHTITGHKEKTYRFSSALEGTWTVTFIADKYCRYPPIPPATVEVTTETI
ncbi:hypothetical protein DACRYDRAFT_115687 [Dacryopinax primogenitus]|uniref:Nucleoporin Pom152 n=1 Tax=Dacryopinax primogenitus (strain DJM 731) TaxID=1858805 RepID=M5FXF0_DACPD|nr:uncharacterized protein DACRYDRAFT_115687 [Dacryopinax primogenitus]EJU02661.1 hypothetical protein DACRYDRAFT_115687 [Dacryopinax primogenitus]